MRIRNSITLLSIIIILSVLSGRSTYAQCLNVDIEVIVDQFANPCNGPITLDAHYPGYTFTWSTGETTRKIVVTKSDLYIVTVDDGFGCVGKDTLQVTFMDKPTLSLGPDPAAQCGGCVKLNPGTDPGLTYLWSTGESSPQITYCKEGTNKVVLKVTNTLGCSATDTVEVTITPGLNISIGPDIAKCDNETVTLSSNYTGSHLWSTGETTSSIQVNSTGYYSLIVSDGTCSGIDTVHVQMNPVPVVDLGPDPATQCGGCVTVDAGTSPGASYVWSNGATTSQIKICTPGNHHLNVIVKSDKGCEAKDTIQFEITPGINVNLGQDVTLCKSEYLIKSNLSGYSYTWNTGATTPDLLVTESGTYYLEATDGSCKGIDSVKVKLLPIPDLNLGADPAPKCGGCQTISVPLDPELDYIWSTGEAGNSIRYCKEGTNDIVLTVINSGGCKDSDTIKVTILDKFNPSINEGMDTTVCKGPVSLNASLIPGASYLWNTGEKTSSIQVNSSGDYYVFIYNLPGCSPQDTLSDTIDVVFRNPYPAPAAITDLSNCNSYKFHADAVPGATYYNWTVPSGAIIQSGQGTQEVVVIAPGNVSGNILVTASNSSPTCKGEPAELEIELGERNVFIPNAFTPNGDGLNDTWVLRNIQYYPDNILVILNRWGNEIYKVEHYNNQWNGSSLNEGSYFYKLIINACGEKKELTGYVTIVR